MRRLAALIVLAPLAVATGGCALQPLYADAGGGAVSAINGLELAPIEGRAGFFVRQALAQRLGTPRSDTPYRLDISLDDDISAFGIRGDSAPTRERRTLRARYRLVDRATGQVLLDQTAGGDVGIDVVSSEYATIAAEQTALERLAEQVADRIVTRLALFARRTAPPAR